MRAAVMRDRKLVIDSLPEPTPGSGEVLVKTLACGICGSDLHALKYADKMTGLGEESGVGSMMDVSRDVVMGHEFCAEIVEHGPNTQKTAAVGSRVCSVPMLLRESGPQAVGYSNNVPGGYAEYMLLSEMMLLEVPNGLSTDVAALTEPMAVGWHAVEKAGLGANDVPLVIGCGPVGLSVIAGLKLKGTAPIIAADFSPMRRGLAERLGADIVGLADPTPNRSRRHSPPSHTVPTEECGSPYRWPQRYRCFLPEPPAETCGDSAPAGDRTQPPHHQIPLPT